jgi:tetrahydromethanopterin S-methyltransferase subunit E
MVRWLANRLGISWGLSFGVVLQFFWSLAQSVFIVLSSDNVAIVLHVLTVFLGIIFILLYIFCGRSLERKRRAERERNEVTQGV